MATGIRTQDRASDRPHASDGWSRRTRHPSRAAHGSFGVVWAYRSSDYHAAALGVAHEHLSPALARSVVARSRVGARTPARRPVSGRRPPPRGGLLRRGQGRPDAAVHGLGRRHLATGRPGHRRALPLGRALVAGRLPRRARGQRPAARRTAPAAAREPRGSAGGQHGRGRRRRAAAAAAHRPPRGDRSRGAGRWAVRGPRRRDGHQRHRGDGVDAGRWSHHRG